MNIDFSAEKARLQARLDRVEKLEKVQVALKALDAKHDAEEAQLDQKHCEEQDAFAKENGYKNFKALMAELAPQPAPVTKKVLKTAPVSPKKQRKPRAKLNPQLNQEIARAYRERGDMTAVQVAAKFGVSPYTVYKIANRLKPPGHSTVL